MVCVYSMGNHLSNQRKELMDSLPTGHTEDGLMIELTLEQTGDDPVSLTDVKFLPTWVYKTLANGGAEYYIFPLDSRDSYSDMVTTLDISDELDASLERTNEIIGEGSEKIKNALPISDQNDTDAEESAEEQNDTEE